MKVTNSEGHVLKERDFGLVEVGKTKVYEYWLVNDEPCRLTEIKVLFENSPLAEELKIIECPKEIGPMGKGKLLIEWRPDLKVKSGLKLRMNVSASEIYE